MRLTIGRGRKAQRIVIGHKLSVSKEMRERQAEDLKAFIFRPKSFSNASGSHRRHG